jgi:transposase
MKRFVEGTDRGQSTLFPSVLDEYVGEDNPVRAIDVFVDGLDLAKLGFDGVAPLATGRPGYHPAPLLKISYGQNISPRLPGRWQPDTSNT